MKEYFLIRRRVFRARKIHPILRRPTLEEWVKYRAGGKKVRVETHRRSGQVLNTRLENTWHHRSSVGHSSSSRDTVFTFQRSVLLESFCFSHMDFTSSPSDPLAGSISHPFKSKLAEFPTAQYSISPVVSHRRHWMINIKGKISSNVYNKLM